MNVKFRKIILIILAAFLTYTACFAVLPYITVKELPESFINQINVADYYGQEGNVCADRVALIEEPKSSLDARIQLINQAKTSLDIAYYVVHMGEGADAFFSSVLAAADRGVSVRLLLDGKNDTFTGDYADMGYSLGNHKNIEIRLYNPINPLKPWTYNGRMHDKYIIADDKLMLLGGRNIGDKYFDVDSYKGFLSIDRDVLVFNTKHSSDDKSSVIYSVINYMNSIWKSKYVVEVFEEIKDTQKETERLNKINKELEAKNSEIYSENVDYYDKTVSANKVTFFSNDTDIYKKMPKVAYIVSVLAESAKEKVVLQSPYIVPDSTLMSHLRALGKKKIDYTILTNSISSSPNLPAYAAYMGARKKIANTGAKVYEFKGQDGIHAKSYIIDDSMSLVGSYNMDYRSAYINTEIMLAIDSPEFTAELDRIINLYKEHSYIVGTNNNFEDVSIIKKALLFILIIPMQLFKFLI